MQESEGGSGRGGDDSQQLQRSGPPLGTAQAKAAQLTSKFTGVCWNKKNKRWQASINSGGKYLYLGSFTSEVEAASVFDQAAIQLRGRDTKLNFPLEDYLDQNGQLIPNEALSSTIAVHEQLVLTQKMATAQALALAGGSLKKPRGGGPGGAGTIGRKLAAKRAAGAMGTGDPLSMAGAGGDLAGNLAAAAAAAAAAAGGSSAYAGSTGGFNGMSMGMDGMPVGMDGYAMQDAAAAVKAGGQMNLVLLQQAAAAAASDAARMSAQQQSPHPSQQGTQQYQQQQMYGKGDPAQQQYALSELLAGFASSAFPAGQHDMQGGQQYPIADFLSQFSYGGDAAAAAALLGPPGSIASVQGAMQQLQEYYANPSAAAAAAAASCGGYQQDSMGQEYGQPDDFGEQMEGVEEQDSRRGGGYTQAGKGRVRPPSSGGSSGKRTSAAAAAASSSVLEPHPGATQAWQPASAPEAKTEPEPKLPQPQERVVINLRAVKQALPAGGTIELLVPSAGGVTGVVYTLPPTGGSGTQTWAAGLWDGSTWTAGGSYNNQDDALSAVDFVINVRSKMQQPLASSKQDAQPPAQLPAQATAQPSEARHSAGGRLRPPASQGMASVAGGMQQAGARSEGQAGRQGWGAPSYPKQQEQAAGWQATAQDGGDAGRRSLAGTDLQWQQWQQEQEAAQSLLQQLLPSGFMDDVSAQQYYACGGAPPAATAGMSTGPVPGGQMRLGAAGQHPRYNPAHQQQQQQQQQTGALQPSLLQGFVQQPTGPLPMRDSLDQLAAAATEILEQQQDKWRQPAARTSQQQLAALQQQLLDGSSSQQLQSLLGPAAGGRPSSSSGAGTAGRPAASPGHAGGPSALGAPGVAEQSLKLIDSIRMLGSLGGLPSNLLGSLGNNTSGLASVEWLVQMLNSTQGSQQAALPGSGSGSGPHSGIAAGAAAAAGTAGVPEPSQQGRGSASSRRVSPQQEAVGGGPPPTQQSQPGGAHKGLVHRSQRPSSTPQLVEQGSDPPPRQHAQQQQQQAPRAHKSQKAQQVQPPPPAPRQQRVPQKQEQQQEQAAVAPSATDMSGSMSAFASSQGLAAALAAAASAAAAGAGTPPDTPSPGDGGAAASGPKPESVPAAATPGTTGGTGTSSSNNTTESGSGFAKFLVDLLSLKQSNSVNASGALPNLEAAAAAAMNAAVTGKDGEGAPEGRAGSSLAGSLAAVQSYLSNINKHHTGDSAREGQPAGEAATGPGMQQQQQGLGASGGSQQQQQLQQPGRDGSKRTLSSLGAAAAGADNPVAAVAGGASASTPPGGDAQDSGPFDQLLSEAAVAEQARAAKRRRVLGSAAGEEGGADSPAGAQRQQGVLQGATPSGAVAAGGDVALVTRDSRASSDSHVRLPQGNSAVGSMAPPPGVGLVCSSSGVGSMAPPPPVDMTAAGAPATGAAGANNGGSSDGVAR